MARSRTGLALWLLLFSFYALTGSGHSGFGDGYLLFRTARSLLDDGSFAIEPVPGAGNLAQRVGVDGRAYAIFAPGLAFADMPMIVLGRHLPRFLQPQARGEPSEPLQRDEFWCSFTNAWVGATTVVLVWLCGVALGFTGGIPLANALLLAVASPLWCYARTDSSEALQGMLLTGATLALLGEAAGSRPRVCFVAGMFLGLAILTKLANALLVPWYVLYVGSGGRASGARARSCFALVAPSVAAVLLYGMYDAMRFGSPIDVGYTKGMSFFGEPLASGSAMLLISASSGLLVFWPATPLLLLGAGWFVRTRERTAILVFGILATLLLVYATNWAFWQFAWGPRYLVPAIPLLALLLLPVLSRPALLVRVATILTVVLGTGVQAITAGASWWHQVLPVYRAVRHEDIRDLLRDPRIAPLRVGAWWIGVVTAEHLDGPAHASLRLLHPPWEDRFPWRRPETTLQALWDVRGLDVWAAPSSWRMPYRPIGKTSAPLTPIASSSPLRILLAITTMIGGVALAALTREARRMSIDPCQSLPDVS